MLVTRAGLLGVALAAGLAGCGEEGDERTRPTGGADLDVVNYALTLEFLELDFYDAVVRGGVLRGRELEVVELIRADEREHVQVLSAAARKLGRPASRPATDFADVVSAGRDRVLRTAAELENLGAAAYLGQLAELTSRDVLATALAIHSVEGRHAAVLNRLIGEPFLPEGALATGLSRSQVLGRAERFL